MATHRTVALSSTVAPGTSDGANFSSFSAPVLNDLGELAFLGSLGGVNVHDTNNTGIWNEKVGTGLALVAREGNQAPGTPSGVTFSELSVSTFSSPVLNDAGKVSFTGTLAGPGVEIFNRRGVWSGGDGTELSLIARSGNQAAGAPAGVTYGSFLGPVLNNNGRTAFKASFAGAPEGGPNFDGIWKEGGGLDLVQVARDGTSAPGTSDGVRFAGIVHYSLNDAGQTAFSGILAGTGVDGTNSTGIWSEGGGLGLALVARGGDPAPGTPNGVTFDSFFAFSIARLNSNGQTVFSGRLTGAGVNSTNSNGIWIENAGEGLTLFARAGSQAPGMPTGTNFISLGFPNINAAGHLVFSATLTGTNVDGTNDFSLWSEGADGSLSVVAREGDAVPGASSGINFSFFYSPVLNSNGQTAFMGLVSGAGIDDSNDRGIWAEDMFGNVHLIALEGDLLDVDDGPGTDFRTIRELSFYGRSGNDDGFRSGFNDLGQIAYRAAFTDGSEGIFISNLVMVPEPTSLSLVALAILCTGGKCFRVLHISRSVGI